MEAGAAAAGEAMKCENLPQLVSSFVDTFVDFSVSGGLFLPPPPPPLGPQQQFPYLTTYPSPPQRLIAVGDLHGDLLKSKQALRLAGLIDASDHWSGGNTTVVQVGDVLDRGGEELKILYFLEKLRRQAIKTGGNIITMNGNHETMNVVGDFRISKIIGERITMHQIYESTPTTPKCISVTPKKEALVQSTKIVAKVIHTAMCTFHV